MTVTVLAEPASSRAEARFATGCSTPSLSSTKWPPPSLSRITVPVCFQSGGGAGCKSPEMPNPAAVSSVATPPSTTPNTSRRFGATGWLASATVSADTRRRRRNW